MRQCPGMGCKNQISRRGKAQCPELFSASRRSQMPSVVLEDAECFSRRADAKCSRRPCVLLGWRLPRRAEGPRGTGGEDCRTIGDGRWGQSQPQLKNPCPLKAQSIELKWDLLYNTKNSQPNAYNNFVDYRVLRNYNVLRSDMRSSRDLCKVVSSCLTKKQ